MTRKCEWCNKQRDGLKEISILSTGLRAAKRREISFFVCPEHELKLRKFYDGVRRYVLLFLGLIIISLICLVTPATCSDNDWAGYLFISSFALIGLTLLLFPFCTPQTIAMMGVAKSIKIARIIGGIIFALGVIVLILAIFYW